MPALVSTPAASPGSRWRRGWKMFAAPASFPQAGRASDRTRAAIVPSGLRGHNSSTSTPGRDGRAAGAEPSRSRSAGSGRQVLRAGFARDRRPAARASATSGPAGVLTCATWAAPARTADQQPGGSPRSRRAAGATESTWTSGSTARPPSVRGPPGGSRVLGVDDQHRVQVAHRLRRSRHCVVGRG